MKPVGGAGLVVIGMLFLYLAITGKLDCFFNFISCISSGVIASPSGTGGTTGSSGSGGFDWGKLWSDYGGKIIGVVTNSGNTTTTVYNPSISLDPTMHH